MSSAPTISTEQEVSAALAVIHEQLDLLCAADVGGVGDGEVLLGLLREHERARRRMAAVDARLVAEIEARSVAWHKGFKNTAGLVRDLLRVGPGEARARVKSAADIGPRRSLLGQPLGPVFEQLAAAQCEGLISEQHARVITNTIDRLPAAVEAEHGQWLQDFLVHHATQLDPSMLARIATRAIDTFDPDGILRDVDYRERTREFGLQLHADGSATPTGSFTAELTEYLLVAMDALAGPTTAAADGDAPAGRDLRTPAQRRHDALLETLKIAVASGLVPKAGGITSTLVITMDEASLRNGNGLAKTSHGTLIPAETAIDWMLGGGAAQVLGVVLNSVKAITAYSNTHRIFTEQQRLAMFGRDRGWCTYPACDAPPGMAQAHHVTDYAVTRTTSVDNGALTCCIDHRDRIQQGWRTIMRDGRPHWIPPAWLDPQQTPRTNAWNQL